MHLPTLLALGVGDVLRQAGLRAQGGFSIFAPVHFPGSSASFEVAHWLELVLLSLSHLFVEKLRCRKPKVSSHS